MGHAYLINTGLKAHLMLCAIMVYLQNLFSRKHPFPFFAKVARISPRYKMQLLGCLRNFKIRIDKNAPARGRSTLFTQSQFCGSASRVHLWGGRPVTAVKVREKTEGEEKPQRADKSAILISGCSVLMRLASRMR